MHCQHSCTTGCGLHMLLATSTACLTKQDGTHRTPAGRLAAPVAQATPDHIGGRQNFQCMVFGGAGLTCCPALQGPPEQHHPLINAFMVKAYPLGIPIACPYSCMKSEVTVPLPRTTLLAILG